MHILSVSFDIQMWCSVQHSVRLVEIGQMTTLGRLYS